MRILREDTVGLIIDLQEKLVTHMHDRDDLVAKNRMLIEGLKLLDVPVVLTEHYPRGLGKTVENIATLFAHDIPFEKITFSCCDDAAIRSRLQLLGKKTVIIAGIEAHVCVLQTMLDLSDIGMLPVIVEDAVSSRKASDKLVALRRMEASGGLTTTAESLLFELMRTAHHPSFKAISALVK